jgi:hypothetical protein
MTPQSRPRDIIEEVCGWLRRLLDGERPPEGLAAEFDGYADDLKRAARDYTTAASWCRLTAAKMRGEDSPESIYPADDEDPADTERWWRWRVP